MAIKINEPSHEAGIEDRRSREQTPIAFKEMWEDLIGEGAFDPEKEAIEWIEKTPFVMEMYYEKGHGLFLVESEALEGGGIASPYTKEELVEE